MPVVEQLPIKPLGYSDHEKKRLIQNITFFGDSAIPEDDPIYKSVWSSAKTLAENGYTIVNGGGPGIMKAATDGAESVNGKTIAVYWQPKLASFFEGKNLANVADESETSSNYVMRTLGLIEKGDAYVVCKGGTGTISEFGMVWCLAKLYYGCHKPVILYGDFWDELIEAFQKTMYLDETELGVLYQAKNVEDILRILADHEKLVEKCVIKSYDDDEGAFIIGSRSKVTADTYTSVSSNYHSEHAGKLVSQEQLDEFISYVNPPAQVLDIGTGPGYDLKYLSERYGTSGIEISKRFVEIAQFENPNSEILFGDIASYDIGQKKFKGIWARDSIHHIPSDKLDIVFKKIYDALVEEGIFYVIVREGEGEFTEEEKKSYSKNKLRRFYHLFSEEELLERAKKQGFELVKLDHVQRSHKWIVGIFRK